jgi:hypothetical protein
MAFKATVDYVQLKVVIDTDSLEPVSVFQNLKSVVTFTYLQNTLQYVNLSAVSVLLDASSKNLFFTVGHPNAEIFAVSEALAVTFSKVLADSATVEEQHALAFSLSAQADTASVSESFSRVVSFVRTFTESINLIDTASNDDPLTTDWSTGIGHSTTLSDSSAFALSTPASDSMAMSEALAASFAKALADTPSVSETLAYSFSTSALDSATMSESISVLYVSGANSVLNASPLNTYGFN